MLVVVLKSQPFFMMVLGLSTYTRPWEEPILPPCQKGIALTSNHGRNQSYHHVRKDLMCICVFWTHHFSLEGTSIWSTPRVSLKYSNFTQSISSIESHQEWLRPRITCELRQDRLHPRTTYRTVYVWATYELRQDLCLDNLSHQLC